MVSDLYFLFGSYLPVYSVVVLDNRCLFLFFNSNAKFRLVVCCAILLASSIIIPISAVGFPDVEPVPSLFVEVLLGSIITAAASLAGNSLA